MNYTANVHGLNLLLVENGGSAAFPLFPRFHGSGAGLQPVPAQKMATIARGQIPCAAANEIPGFPCSLRKLGAPSVFSLFPLECRVPSADQAQQFQRDPFHFWHPAPSGKFMVWCNPFPGWEFPPSLGITVRMGAEVPSGMSLGRAPSSRN